MNQMLTGIVETSLYVDDPERSARFYEGVFGFTRMVVIDRLIAMNVRAGQVLLLFRKRASTDHDGDGQLHLAFGTSMADLPRCEDILSKHGIAIETRTNWERGGTSIYFRDPDGHLLELATPGVWENY